MKNKLIHLSNSASTNYLENFLGCLNKTIIPNIKKIQPAHQDKIVRYYEAVFNHFIKLIDHNPSRDIDSLKKLDEKLTKELTEYAGLLVRAHELENMLQENSTQIQNTAVMDRYTTVSVSGFLPIMLNQSIPSNSGESSNAVQQTLPEVAAFKDADEQFSQSLDFNTLTPNTFVDHNIRKAIFVRKHCHVKDQPEFLDVQTKIPLQPEDKAKIWKLSEQVKQIKQKYPLGLSFAPASDKEAIAELELEAIKTICTERYAPILSELYCLKDKSTKEAQALKIVLDNFGNQNTIIKNVAPKIREALTKSASLLAEIPTQEDQSQKTAKFAEAESWAIKAVILAHDGSLFTPDPQNPTEKYTIEQCVKLSTEYFKANTDIIKEMRKTDKSVSFDPKMVAMRKFTNAAKNHVNLISNYLMVLDPSFAKNRTSFIKSELIEKNSAKFTRMRDRVQYRSVRPNGDYGTPETTFLEGMAPQFLSMWLFQKGLINIPSVNDAAVVEGQEMGWTSGIPSTSASLEFVAGFDYAKCYGQSEGWIYAASIDEAASVAPHITINSGHSGENNKTNAEAAKEYMLTFIEPSRILGARKVYKDGSFCKKDAAGNIMKNSDGEPIIDIIINPKYRHTAFSDIEYYKFFTCESVDELRLISYLVNKSADYIDSTDETVKAEIKKTMEEKFHKLTPVRQTYVRETAKEEKRAMQNQALIEISKLPKEKSAKIQHIQTRCAFNQTVNLLPCLSHSNSTMAANNSNNMKHPDPLTLANDFGLEFNAQERASKLDPVSTPIMHGKFIGPQMMNSPILMSGGPRNIANGNNNTNSDGDDHAVNDNKNHKRLASLSNVWDEYTTKMRKY